MYVEPDFKTKKALKEAIAAGHQVIVFQPGLGAVPTGQAQVAVEGPHYPKPHTWYATVKINNSVVVKVS